MCEQRQSRTCFWKLVKSHIPKIVVLYPFRCRGELKKLWLYQKRPGCWISLTLPEHLKPVKIKKNQQKGMRELPFLCFFWMFDGPCSYFCLYVVLSLRFGKFIHDFHDHQRCRISWLSKQRTIQLYLYPRYSANYLHDSANPWHYSVINCIGTMPNDR